MGNGAQSTGLGSLAQGYCTEFAKNLNEVQL
jgi:hypothetical protein